MRDEGDRGAGRRGVSVGGGVGDRWLLSRLGHRRNDAEVFSCASIENCACVNSYLVPVIFSLFRLSICTHLIDTVVYF